MRVEGGNLIGTQDCFHFFQAEVVSVRFPQLNPPTDAAPERSLSARSVIR